MRARLTERIVREAEPGERDRLIWDEDCPGLVLAVYASGRRAFALHYRLGRRKRSFTIGRWPDWSVAAAREEARRLRREIDRGTDPLADREEAIAAPTVADLIAIYRDEHLPKLAKRNAADQRSMLEKLVAPAWRARRVGEITPACVDRLLDRIAEGRARPAKDKAPSRRGPLIGSRPTPIRANRVGEVLRKMFGIAVERRMRGDNPASGFKRRIEQERERYLERAEIERLAKALAAHPDQGRAALVRMLMLTGARLSEVRTARFEDFNLTLEVWTKPAASTKQRRTHRVPISADVAAIVRLRSAAVPPGCPWLFPGEKPGAPVAEVRRFWSAVCATAGIGSTRLHDLRHTFASLLVSGGASLEMIGKLLGHSQSRTTQRYAHLMDSPLRQGVDAVAEALRPRPRLVEGGGDRG